MLEVARTTSDTSARWRRAATCVLALVFMGAAGCGSVLERGRTVIGGAPMITPPPAALPPVESAGEDALLGGVSYSVRGPDEDWGVGYLTAPGRNLSAIQLPLMGGPRDDHWGWLIEGRGYDMFQDIAPPPRPGSWLRLLEGDQALIVLQERRGGWLELRWGEPDDIRGGVGWTTTELARQAGLTYVPWSSAFIGAGGLVFRDEELVYNVRNGPGIESNLVRRITGRDYDVQAEQISGDWMRVRVFTPPRCAPRSDASGSELLLGGPQASGLAGAPVEVETRVAEGWLKWRSDDKGPWLTRANICVQDLGPVG